jgi:oligopeptide transport system ATP-binding protein
VFAIDHLEVRFDTPAGEVAAVRDVTLAVNEGECLGIVGESGCGKSQLVRAAFGLLAANGRASGRARLDGIELLDHAGAAARRALGTGAAFVFQDPMTALTPHMRIGAQLTEVLTTHGRVARNDARRRAQAMLELVQISDAGHVLRQYPHELSGGMRQRVLIAMALLGRPKLLIADEPTTALDVTVQAQILALLRDLRSRLGMALILITHDFGVVAGLADRVAVMYAGRIVEQGPIRTLLARPRHPYTRALLASIPGGSDLPTAIGGQPPEPGTLPEGCAFAPRCSRRVAACDSVRPDLRPVGEGIEAACHDARVMP